MADQRDELKDIVLFSAKAATGYSTVVLDVSSFRNVVLSVASTGTATLTMKILGALAVKGTDGTPSQGAYIAPDFTAAASPSNAWDYVQAINLNTGAAVNGSTGVVFSGTDAVYLLEVNTNLIDFLTVQVTSRSGGSVTVKAATTTNI